MTVTLTLGANIGAAEYTVSYKSGAADPLTGTFTGVAATLTEAKAVSDNLVLTNVNGTEATTIVKGYNQFGEEVTLDATNLASPKCTTNFPTYSSKDGVVNFKTAGSPTIYTVGEKVILTFTYASNTKVFSHEFTVVSQSYAKEMTFGDVTTDTATLKTKPLYKKNLTSGTNYYIPVVVKDQYGTAMSADKLNAEFNASRLFVTPSASAIVTVPAAANQTTGKPFSEKSDGTVIMKIASDNALQLYSGKGTISILSIGGATFTKEVEVMAEPDVDSLTLDVPELHKGKEATLGVTATDKAGANVDLYNATFTVTDNGKVLTISGISTNGKTTITANDGVLKATKNAGKKTVTITYTPTSTQTTASFTWNSATPKAGIAGPYTVGAKVTAATIKGLESDVKTVLEEGTANTTTLAFDYLDSTGETMKDESAISSTVETLGTNATAPSTTHAAAGKDFMVTTKLATTNGAVTTLNGFHVTPANSVAATVSDTVLVQLWSWDATNSKWVEADSKNITITTVDTGDITYGIAAKDTLNVKANVSATQPVAVALTAKYNDQEVVSQVAISTLKVTTPGFKVVPTNTVNVDAAYADDITAAEGTYSMTAVLSNNQTVTGTGKYSKAASVPTSVKLVKEANTTAGVQDADKVITSDEINLTDVTAFGFNNTATNGTYKLYVVDQYGAIYGNSVVTAKDITDSDNPVAVTATVTDGYVVIDETGITKNASHAYAITITAGSVTRTITVSVNNGAAKATTYAIASNTTAKSGVATSANALTVKDQYNDAMTLAAQNTESMTAGTNTGSETMSIAWTTNGAITLTQSASDATIGDTFTVSVGSQTIKAECTTGGAAGTAEWTLSI